MPLTIWLYTKWRAEDAPALAAEAAAGKSDQLKFESGGTPTKGLTGGAAASDAEAAPSDAGDWIAMKDPQTGKPYYYNTKTMEMKMERPRSLSNASGSGSGAAAAPK